MKARYKPDASRRSINLMLNEELVMEARELTDNLSDSSVRRQISAVADVIARLQTLLD